MDVGTSLPPQPKCFPVNSCFHVLLVEDDVVTLKAVEQLLRHCGYQVTTAKNGREAMQLLSDRRRKQFDLILTDVIMPEVSGFDLVKEVVHGRNRDWNAVPVVVMSAEDSQTTVLEAFEAGAADFLVKPIRRNELTTLWQHVWRANKTQPGSPAVSPAGGKGPLAALLQQEHKNSSDASTTSMERSNGASTGASRDHMSAGPGAGAGLHIGRSLGTTSMDSCYPDATCFDSTALETDGTRAKRGKVNLGKQRSSSSLPSSVPSAACGSHEANERHAAGSDPTALECNKVQPARPVPDKSFYSSTSNCSGLSVALPLGLQELAALGQQRQDERDSGKPATEPNPGCALGHSDRSAFSAFTVFLPRLTTPSLVDSSMGQLCARCEHPSDSQRCIPEQAAAHMASGPLVLPDHVAQLICALSQRAVTGKPAAPELFPRLHAPMPQAKPSSGHRQAAVAKYLEKKKLRNFHKKVRYESRKRLAEARPRVRGQFAKQVAGEKVDMEDHGDSSS